MIVETLMPPVLPDTVSQLLSMWEGIFGISFAECAPVLAGEERADNDDVYFLAREDGQLAGTCHLTIGKAAPALGGLGEVAVPEAFRGRGIATALCTQARDAFFSRSGRALFLATSNPAAFRIYQLLGWQPLSNAHVMVCLAGEGSPEAFLAEYFAQPRPARVAEGSTADRIPMIPLILAPHHQQVLDANTNLVSTRYAVQESCMGLYPRYAGLRLGGRGTWFSAYDDAGRLVGLATTRLDDNQAQVDGFTHPLYTACYPDLLSAAITWSGDHAASTCRASLPVDEKEKIAFFIQLGFVTAGVEDEMCIWVLPHR